MRRAIIVGLIVIALPVLLYAALRLSWELGGEVVELHTYDAAGGELVSRLWIVDVDDHAYLRTGDKGAAWLARLRVNPQVMVKRAGEMKTFLAVTDDDAELRDRVNAAVLAKYGFAESSLRMVLLDPEHAVAIRLDAP